MHVYSECSDLIRRQSKSFTNYSRIYICTMYRLAYADPNNLYYYGYNFIRTYLP